MSFDGIPFSVDKVSILDCHYGELAILEEKSKQKKNSEVARLTPIGCPAKIHVLTHTHFTQKFKSCQAAAAFDVQIATAQGTTSASS